MNKQDCKAPIFAISRLRMGIDGAGITTLVTFMDCPLHCKYCLNDRCHDSVYEADGVTLKKGTELLSPQELYDRVKIDNLYFQVSAFASALRLSSLHYMRTLSSNQKNYVE